MGNDQARKPNNKRFTCRNGNKGKGSIESSSTPKIKKSDSGGQASNVPRNYFIRDADSPYKYSINVFGRQKYVIVRQNSAEDTWPGGALWDVGVLLANVFCAAKLSPIHSNRWTRMKVLELGAGVGLTGIVTGVLGAQQVLVTDLPVVVERITKPNVELNGEHYRSVVKRAESLRVKAQTLRWGNTEDEQQAILYFAGAFPDLIIAGDVSYQHKPGAPSHFDDLVQTVLNLSNQETIFVFGHRVRMEASNDLLTDFQRYFDYVEDPIPAHLIDPSFSSVGKHNITIHVMKRSAKAFAKKQTLEEN